MEEEKMKELEELVQGLGRQVKEDKQYGENGNEAIRNNIEKGKEKLEILVENLNQENVIGIELTNKEIKKLEEGLKRLEAENEQYGPDGNDSIKVNIDKVKEKINIQLDVKAKFESKIKENKKQYLGEFEEEKQEQPEQQTESLNENDNTKKTEKEEPKVEKTSSKIDDEIKGLKENLLNIKNNKKQIEDKISNIDKIADLRKEIKDRLGLKDENSSEIENADIHDFSYQLDSGDKNIILEDRALLKELSGNNMESKEELEEELEKLTKEEKEMEEKIENVSEILKLKDEISKMLKVDIDSDEIENGYIHAISYQLDDWEKDYIEERRAKINELSNGKIVENSTKEPVQKQAKESEPVQEQKQAKESEPVQEQAKEPEQVQEPIKENGIKKIFMNEKTGDIILDLNEKKEPVCMKFKEVFEEKNSMYKRLGIDELCKEVYGKNPLKRIGVKSKLNPAVIKAIDIAGGDIKEYIENVKNNKEFDYEVEHVKGGAKLGIMDKINMFFATRQEKRQGANIQNFNDKIFGNNKLLKAGVEKTKTVATEAKNKMGNFKESIKVPFQKEDYLDDGLEEDEEELENIKKILDEEAEKQEEQEQEQQEQDAR